MFVAVRVHLDKGKTWCFATAADWPGWCRRGRGEDAAIDTLLNYRERYAAATGAALPDSEIEIIGAVDSSYMADFGAPGEIGAWDHEPVSPEEADRQAVLLESCWAYFDSVVAGSPESLRKGPRGGGRDRDPMVDHVREAERSYGRKLGVRVPPRTPWPDQRAVISAAIRANPSEVTWPLRYFVRRTAWHVLDHAWEMEDRSE